MTLIAGGGGVLLDRTLGDDPRPVVLVNAPGYLPVHFFATGRAWHGRAHPPVDLLYAGSADVEVVRTGEQTLVLRAVRRDLAAGIELLERAPDRPLRVNEVITSARMRAQVLEVRDGAPIRVRFDFTLPLSDVRVYAWQGRRVQPLLLPSVGAHALVQAASGL
jgi:hypothetical protein